MIEDTGINRNIMECKGYGNIIVIKTVQCINRNIMECKVERKIEFLNRNAVLIETLWNVKITEILSLTILHLPY